MTEGRQPFTAEIKTLAKGPSTYDPLENGIRKYRPFADGLANVPNRPEAEVSGTCDNGRLAMQSGHCRQPGETIGAAPRADAAGYPDDDEEVVGEAIPVADRGFVCSMFSDLKIHGRSGVDRS